jgi:hypothetical protein
MGCVGTDPDLETSCTCGEPCNLFKGAVCQADGKACAINKRPPLCFTTGGVKPLPTGTTCGIKVKDSIVEVNDACVTDVATLLTKFNKGETVAEIGAKLTLDKSTIAATAKALSDFKAALDRDGAELRLKVKGCNAAADACTDTELAEFEVRSGLLAAPLIVLTDIGYRSPPVCAAMIDCFHNTRLPTYVSSNRQSCVGASC